MSKIPVSKLISLFRQMKDEHWHYTYGAAQQDNVDCSGAFVWVYSE